jgi:hypothetical protein
MDETEITPFKKIKLNTEIKLSKNRLDNLKNHKKYNLFVYFLFLMSVIFYYISLLGCKEGFSKCQKTEVFSFYVKRGICCVISSITFDITLLFQFIIKLSKINILFFLLYILLFFYLHKEQIFIHMGHTIALHLYLLYLLVIYIYIYFIYFFIICIIKNDVNIF